MRTSRPLIAALGLAALLGAGTTAGPAWADDENGTSYSYGYDNNENKKPKKGDAPATPACGDLVPGGGGSTDVNGDLVLGDFGFESFLQGPVCVDGLYELTITDSAGSQVVVADPSATAGTSTVAWFASVVPDANGCVTVTARVVLDGVEVDSAPDPGTVEEVCTGSPGSISWR